MCEKETKSEMIIKVGQAKGIVYEGYDDFEGSIFKNVYKRAKGLTGEIIKRNEELRGLEGHGNEFRNKEQVENIIAFLGGRGTGKTSAMLSFMEGLKDHYKKHNVIVDDNKNYNFISLEWIDASFLEDNEDIFVMILAKMFGELLKYNDKIGMNRDRAVEYDFRNLYQQFEKIYRRISNLKRKDEVYNEELPVDFLKDLSRSTEVRSDFRRLVRDFIRFVVEVEGIKESSNDTYVVIAVDDIDLNIERGYDILETIHKYLMVPGVIVLVALNYEEMRLCCEKHYIRNYGQFLPEKVVNDIGQRAIEMSEQYLEKILPPYMRLYMPSLLKRDFQFRNPKIKVERPEEAAQLMEIKEYMFDLIYKRTGVFFDAIGKKRHFMEPNTLRNLNAICEIYNNMTLLPDTDKNYLTIYDENYYKMIDDILFRFASDSLPNREYRMLMKWSEEDILRRGEEIVKDVIASIPAKPIEDYGNKSNREISDFPKDYRIWGYSYGELLRALYCLSRMGIYDKRLVHVLLAQYTVVFSRIFKHYEKEEKKGADEEKVTGKNCKRLSELMGKSVGGSWAKYLLGQGGSSKPWFALLFSKDTSVVLFRTEKGSFLYNEFETIENGEIEKNKIKDKCKELIYKSEFEALKTIMFFFDCFDTELDDWFEIYKPAPKMDKKAGDVEPGKSTTADASAEEKLDEYKIALASRTVKFNVLNFVQNCFNYENIIRRFYKSMLTSLYRCFGIDEIVTNDDIEALLDKDKSTDSLFQKFDEWSNKDGRLVIPVYNLDITYNLIKRLCVMEHAEGQCVEDFQKIKHIFKIIEIKLKEQDSFYEKICENIKYGKIFEKCPIVRRICDEGNNEAYAAILNSIAGQASAADSNKEEGIDTIKFN